MNTNNNDMKVLKYIAAIVLIASMAACGGDRKDATLGGTQDTTAKAGTGQTGTSTDLDSNQTDSVNRGNADPSGRGSSDTLNARPVH
jgi:hypothetical protein